MAHDDTTLVTVLTPQQVADNLGCSKVHVYRLINGGDLKAIDISAPGSRRTKTRILVEDLNNYIKGASKTG